MKVRTPVSLWCRAGISSALVLAATSTGAGGAAAEGNAPAGNNGMIKIDEFDMDDGNTNDPHVACGFSISFFGYDAGDQSATIDLDPSAPTDGGQPLALATSWHTDERTGGNQLNDNVQVTPEQVAAMVDGVEPHPQQGYHVRVSVHVTGSQGADVKHKMFWVEPCAVADEEAGAVRADNESEEDAAQQDAANVAAATEFADGSSADDAYVAAAAAAVGAGASAEESEMYAAAAVITAGYINQGAPAVALALAGSTTG